MNLKFKNLFFKQAIFVIFFINFFNLCFADDLKEVINNSIKTNLNFLNSKSELKNLKEDIIQSKEKKKLSITAFLNAGKVLDLDCEKVNSGCFSNSFAGGISNNFSLFDGGIISSEIKNNEIAFEIKRLEVENLKNNMIYDVIEAYLNVLTDRNLIELSKKNIEVINKEFNATESRFMLGEVTNTEVAQASASLASAESNFAARVGALTSSDLRFENLVGYKPKKLSDIKSLPVLPETLKKALDIANSKNPSLNASKLRVEQFKILLDIAKNGPFLSLNLTSDITFGKNNNSSFSSADLMVEGSIPLNANKRFLSEEREAKNNYLISLASYDLDVKNVERAVISAWSNLQVTSSIVKSREKELQATILAHNGLKEESYLGLRPSIDIFNSEKLLFDSNLNLERSQKNYLLAQFNLLKQIGILSISNF